MTSRIRVTGFLQPYEPRHRRHRQRPVALIRPLNLVGPAGAMGVLIATLLWGTPHVLLFTTGSRFGGSVFYDDCAYAGLDGRMIHLRGSNCPLFRMLKHSGRS